MRNKAPLPNLPAGYVAKRTPNVSLPANPIEPVPFDRADHLAIKAMASGTATPDQQQRALGWIIFACGGGVDGIGDLSFRPGGADGERATSFNEGKRFIAIMINRLRMMPSPNPEHGEQ